MATERGGKEEPTRGLPQQQLSKGREDHWKICSEGSQGCCAELTLGLILQTLSRIRDDDQPGFYKHLDTMNLGGKRDRRSAYVEDENGELLGDVELIRKRWVRWFHTLLSAKSPGVDPNITEGLGQ